MKENLYAWIKNLAVFYLLFTMVLHLVPAGKYEKYVRFFMGLLLILILIVTAILKDALGARDRLGMYLCVGVMAMIGFQSMINIGMVVRLLPVIGITLPFFSAGGTSISLLMAAVGILFNISRYD